MLIRRHKPSIIYMQETMVNPITEKDLEYYWEGKEVRAVFQAANGLSGELICIW